MIIKVNQQTSKAEFDEKLKSLQPKKKQLDLTKYINLLPDNIDGLKYQKRIRSEWK